MDAASGVALAALSLNSLPGTECRAGAPSPGKSLPDRPCPDQGDDENLEPMDGVGELVALPARGKGRGDQRRQSLALSQSFQHSSMERGLLAEGEICVGDEDIQVPLSRSSRMLGGAENHSMLWLDPDTEDVMLGADLPSPGLFAAGEDGCAAVHPPSASTSAGSAGCTVPAVVPVAVPGSAVDGAAAPAAGAESGVGSSAAAHVVCSGAPDSSAAGAVPEPTSSGPPRRTPRPLADSVALLAGMRELCAADEASPLLAESAEGRKEGDDADEEFLRQVGRTVGLRA